MNLQEWDNVISIVSNTVTALGVVGGVIFGGSKLNDYIKTKNREVAFHSALSLYDEIISYRGKLVQMRIRLNYSLEIINKSYNTNTALTANEYFELQELGLVIFETSLNISNLFIKTHNFNGVFNQESLAKVNKVVGIAHEITNHINYFFNCAIQASKGKVANEEDIAKLYSHSKKFDELTQEYLESCTIIQQTKFSDFCDIK